MHGRIEWKRKEKIVAVSINLELVAAYSSSFITGRTDVSASERVKEETKSMRDWIWCIRRSVLGVFSVLHVLREYNIIQIVRSVEYRVAIRTFHSHPISDDNTIVMSYTWTSIVADLYISYWSCSEEWFLEADCGEVQAELLLRMNR